MIVFLIICVSYFFVGFIVATIAMSVKEVPCWGLVSDEEDYAYAVLLWPLIVLCFLWSVIIKALYSVSKRIERLINRKE